MIPIGTEEFSEFRDDGFYYVDKSELISDIIANKSKVFLFTRPRRFGKTLNLSMLDCFFNLKYRDNHWFDGLKVMDDPKAVSWMNSRPVIRINMKDLFSKDYGLFVSKLHSKIQDLYGLYKYLQDSEALDDADRDLFRKGRMLGLSTAELQMSLLRLCNFLKAHHGIGPIVLIDEYDDPINRAFGHDSYQDVLDFLREFYSGTLKGNTSLEFAVVTGVMQIAKESIFSGLNNLEVNNIFSTECDERFGFTASEVRTICEDYGRPDAFETAREWYDGYRFGDAEIYNPWSVLRFVKKFEAKTYWANTSGNDIIDTLIGMADDVIYGNLMELGSGKTIGKVDITETLSMDDIFYDKDAIYSLLAVSGYLKAVPGEGKGYDLSIPNREMYDAFVQAMLRKKGNRTISHFYSFFHALQVKDIPEIEAKAFKIFQNFQDWDLVDERSYRHILASGAMCCCGRYTVSTEGQDGNGRADMLMRRNTPAAPNIVVEFKKSKSDDEKVHIREAEDAIRQIKDKEYFAGLRGRTLLYGIVFDNKMAKVLLEEMDL